MTRNRTATRIGLLIGAVLLVGSLSAAAIAQSGGPSGSGTPTLAPSTSQPGDDDGTADQGHGDRGTEATDTPSPSDASSSSSTPSNDPSGDDSDDNSGPGNMDDGSDDNSGPGNMDDDDADQGDDHGMDDDDDHGHGDDDDHGHGGDDDDGTVDQGHGDR